MSDWKLTCQKYKTNNPDAKCNCSVCRSERLAAVELFAEKVKKELLRYRGPKMPPRDFRDEISDEVWPVAIDKSMTIIDQLVKEERK